MKTKGYILMYLGSLLAMSLMTAFGLIYRYFTGTQPADSYLRYPLMGLDLVFLVAFFVGLIGAIVTSNDKGKAAFAVFGSLIGVGMCVASFFLIQELVKEGPPDIGHMMVLGVLPIPLGFMVTVFPLLGGLALYKSVKTLLFDQF